MLHWKITDQIAGVEKTDHTANDVTNVSETIRKPPLVKA